MVHFGGLIAELIVEKGLNVSMDFWEFIPGVTTHQNIRYFGQCQWLSWKRGCFPDTRDPRLESHHQQKFYLPIVQLKIEKTKIKKKKPGMPHL